MAERKKQLIIDLLIIFVVSFLALFFVLGIWGNANLNAFGRNTSIHIILRVLVIGLCGQFALAGFGICVDCLIRKEKFSSFGLTTKNLIPALLLSLLCCVPDFIFNLSIGNVHSWCPFIDVHSTKEVLTSGFPSNVIGMIITATCWGFFEGFNYVVIRDKLTELLPSRLRFLDWGALICAVMCILIHGAVGVTAKAVIEMFTTMFLIYGMLIVRKETGNAWGCVLIFFVYWNAL